MEIYLIRHTTPDINKSICYGQSDILLANTFLEEASIIQEKFKHISFDAVFSSPLYRCVELAKLLKPNFYLDNRLKELDFGDWELKKWDDIPLSESRYWMNDFVNEAPPNGESYVALQQRVLDFYNELVDKPFGRVVIITHAGVIRALLSYLRGIALVNSFDLIKVGYGEVFKCVITKSII